jgi:DNA (cytosine-5)-methyltransferase 1
MRRPRLLDLFSGAGGAAMGYHQAGFDVVGVDIAAQPHYPFEFHQADALTFPLDGFDAIHASAPCQRFTAYGRRRGVDRKRHLDLIGLTRIRLQATGLPYILENVEGAPLHNPIRLCGTSFGPDLQRHRLFESNTALVGLPCDHDRNTSRWPQATNRQNRRRTIEIGVYRISLRDQRRAMCIGWMTLEELSQAIPPAYTRFIGEQLLEHLGAAA